MKLLCAPVLALLILFAGCSKPSAKEYYSKAEVEYKAATNASDTLKNRDNMGRLFESALDNYQKVVQEYPNDPLAESALFKSASIQNDNMQDPDRAIAMYRMYVDRFPDSKRAPYATFMVAYLYHNNLKMLDSASVWYKRFLERYPQHELAVSAQFELGSLGKSPDELLPADSLSAQKEGVTASNKAKKTGARQHPL